MRLESLGLAALLALLGGCDAAPSSASEQDFMGLSVTADHCSLEGRDLRTQTELLTALRQVSRKDAISIQLVMPMQDRKAAAQVDAMLGVVREAFVQAHMKPAGMVRDEVL